MSSKFTTDLENAMENLHTQGAFLTVKCKGITNTMTISWGNVGYEWNRPIFTLLVRKSRFTHELIEKANEFTISIPYEKDKKSALAICGSKSGRDLDKIKECNLTLKDSGCIDTPYIEGCKTVYICKVVYKQDISPALLDNDIHSKNYSSGDYHTMYFGEILKTIITD